MKRTHCKWCGAKLIIARWIKKYTWDGKPMTRWRIECPEDRQVYRSKHTVGFTRRGLPK